MSAAADRRAPPPAGWSASPRCAGCRSGCIDAGDGAARAGRGLIAAADRAAVHRCTALLVVGAGAAHRRAGRRPRAAGRSSSPARRCTCCPACFRRSPQDLRRLRCSPSCCTAVGRALDSGPLEAWYVDTVHALDPDADVAPGLGWHGAADGGGLALGAVVGGLLPGLVGGGARRAGGAVRRRAVAASCCYVAAVLRAGHRARGRRGRAACAAELAAGRARRPRRPSPTRCGWRSSDGPLRLVLLLTAVGGVGIVAFELLGPVRFAELAGGPDDGAAVFGDVLAASFGAAALGARCSRRAPRRLLRGSTRVDLRRARACSVRRGLSRWWPAPTVLLAGAGLRAVLPRARRRLAAAVRRAAQPGRPRRTARRRCRPCRCRWRSAASPATCCSRCSPSARAPTPRSLAVAAVVLLSALLCLRLPQPPGRAADEEALLDQPVARRAAPARRPRRR